MKIALIGCSKRKRPDASPAQDLYLGAMFSLARRWAGANADAWYILSALHGVLAPHDVIDPYDVTMQDLARVSRRTHPSATVAWASRCRGQLMGARGGEPRGARVMPGDTVVILAGAAYWGPLASWLTSWGAEVQTPLAGLGIGQQLAWLAAENSKEVE